MKNLFIQTKLSTLLLLLILATGVGWGQTATIGSGTNVTTSSNPIDGYYKSFRYQVIYTAAELTAAGMPANSEINGIGFSISGDYGGGNLLGYKIRMAHTSEVNSAVHNTAVLTEVKNSFSYNPTVTAAGAFDMISFNTNFTWNGTSNIVIDICSDGSNPYTSPYGSVRIISSSTTNGSRSIRSDSGSSQCGINTSTINTTKPQIRFSYTLPLCSGTPTPGNTLASLNPIATGSSTVLSLQNATTGSGVTYQWKSSSDNVTYTNISGGTNATYSASPTASTYYLCEVTCSGSTTGSNAVLVNLITCYVPTALTSSSISYQSATIGWTAPALGTSPAGYEYEVRTSGAAGSGATGLVTSGTTTAPTVSASLTGLSGGITYSYYVRSNCGGGDFSTWSNAGTFTTLSCNIPTSITSSAITATTATISWTAPTIGSPAGYEYEVRTSGAAGSGATGLVISGTTTAPTVSTSLTGLTAVTSYYVYVRTNCYSGFNSSWTSAATLTTLCNSVATFPFTESFEGISSGVPTCWGRAGTLSSSSTYHFSSFSTGQTGKGLRFDSFNSSAGSTSELTTPTLNLSSLTTAELKFYFKNPTGGNFEVLISNDNGATYTSLQSSLTGQTSWLQKTYTITSYISSTVKIKFKGTSNYGSGDAYIYLDEIIVQAIPSCLPTTALTSSSITYQTANISWTAPSSGTSPAGYEYEVRTSGAAGSGATGLVTSGTTTAPTVSASLTGLSGGTTYSYYVRSNCGGGDFSTWSNASTFTTLSCNVPTAITSSVITYTSATIGWTAPATGSPAGYEYEVRTSGAAGSGATGLIASGSTTAPTVSTGISGLTAATTYSIYVRSNCYTGFNSAWTSASTFTTLKTEPSNQITSLAAGTVTATDIPLTWIAAIAGTQAPDGYLVKASSVDLNSVTDPVDGTDPANVTAFTSNAANKKQTTGTATSTSTFTGTVPGTMYYYKVYAYTNSGTGIDFKTDNPATLSHATKPNTVSSTLTNETITSNSIGFSWSSTAYLSGSNEYLIFAKAGSAVTAGTPTLNPATYTANGTFGSGTTYEADASAFCVYKGDGTSISLTGLNASTTYHFLIYAVVSNANSNGSYSFAVGTSVNRTTPCAPISSLPWTEGFESVTIGTTALGTSTSLPNCWNSQSTKWSSTNATANNTAKTGAKYIRYVYSSTNAFIWTPGFQLTAGVSYDFSFYAQGDGGTGWINDVFVNTSVSSTGATQLTPTYTPAGIGTLTIQSYNLVTRTFVPSTSGIYYFAIRGNQSSSAPWYMAFDDFKLDISPNTWTGTVSNSWNTASNWSANTVPTISDNIAISTNGTNAPVLDADVTIPVGKSLTVSGTGTLTIAPGKALTIAGTADFGGKAVIFKSDATGSGLFGPLTGTLIGATNVQVERYLPAKRAYRFLSPSVTTTTTIKANWQENAGTTAGLGTHITGTGGATNGFDVTSANNPSMFSFNNATGAWSAVTNTNVNTLTAGTPYRLMVRGDRTTDLTTNTPTPTNTILRTTGTLKTGNFTPTINQTADGLSFVGNPYQAPVDIKTILTASSANMNTGVVYYWDPTLNTRGGFVTRTLSANTNDVTSNFNEYVQPGQAVFVKRDNTANAASITITESHKSINNAAAGVFKTTTNNDFGILRANLQANMENQWQTTDAALAIFNNNYTWNVTAEDATKMTNLDEEVSFMQDNTSLAIAMQNNPAVTNELPIKIDKLRHTNYQWQFELANYDGAAPYLLDTQTNTYTAITNTTVVPFTAAANTMNRFKIVFTNAVLHTDTFTSQVGLYPNPAKAGSSFYLTGATEASVNVFNLLGQNIPVQTQVIGQALQVTPSHTIAKGVYLVSITSEGNTQQVKWIVE